MNKEELIKELDELGFVPYEHFSTAPVKSYIVMDGKERHYEVNFMFVNMQFKFFYRYGKFYHYPKTTRLRAVKLPKMDIASMILLYGNK